MPATWNNSATVRGRASWAKKRFAPFLKGLKNFPVACLTIQDKTIEFSSIAWTSSFNECRKTRSGAFGSIVNAWGVTRNIDGPSVLSCFHTGRRLYLRQTRDRDRRASRLGGKASDVAR